MPLACGRLWSPHDNVNMKRGVRFVPCAGRRLHAQGASVGTCVMCFIRMFAGAGFAGEARVAHIRRILHCDAVSFPAAVCVTALYDGELSACVRDMIRRVQSHRFVPRKT